MVSVILPVRDGQEWIGEALESLLEQTVPPGEILIGDDGSRDGTIGVVEAMAAPSIRLVRNSENQGISRTCNQLVALARGRYIARMDADDVALPRRFELQSKAMRETGDTVVGTWARRFGGADTLHATPVTHEEILAQLGLSCPFVNPTVMVDRERLGLEPLYRPETSYAADFELFASLRKRARFSNIPEVLLMWRHHSRNVGTKSDTLASQNRTVSRVRARIWRESGIELTSREEAALDALVFGQLPSLGASGPVISAFRKALDHPRPDGLWAPVPAIRNLFQSQWEFYCRMLAWGDVAVLPVWWRGVRSLGGVPSPRTFSVLAAKSLLGRRNPFLSRFLHSKLETPRSHHAGASRGSKR